jgi:hypothetical protein
MGRLYALAPVSLPGTVRRLQGHDYDALVWGGALKRSGPIDLPG